MAVSPLSSARVPQHLRPVPGAPDDRRGTRVSDEPRATTHSFSRSRSRRRSFRLVLLPLPLIETSERGGRDAVRRAFAWFAGVLVLVHLPSRSWGLADCVRLLGAAEARPRGREPGRRHPARAPPARPALGHASRHCAGSRDAVGTLPDLIAIVSSLAVVAAVLYVAWSICAAERDRLARLRGRGDGFRRVRQGPLAAVRGVAPAACAGGGLVASGVLVACSPSRAPSGIASCRRTAPFSIGATCSPGGSSLATSCSWCCSRCFAQAPGGSQTAKRPLMTRR